MKLKLAFLLLFTCSTIYGQNLLIANNNPGVQGGNNVFSGTNALQNAFSNASPGDIIYLVGSGTSYGNLTINKAISLIGAGLDPEKDNPAISRVNRIVITASNVRISGIHFPNNFDSGFPSLSIDDTGNIDNLIVDNCLFTNVSAGGSGNAGNIIIQNCILQNTFALTLSIINLKLSYSGVRISNNIIYCNPGNTTTGAIRNVNSGIIEHNLFVGPTNGSGNDAFEIVTSSTIRNNIFYGVEPRSDNNYSGNEIYNNLSAFAANNAFMGGNGNVLTANQTGVDPQLQNMTFGSSYNFSRNPFPQTGSPALGSAHDDTDIGLTGGGTPFDRDGSLLPTVQMLDIPALVPQGSDVNVQIKAKGN